jgi:catechol-2,3-dioxygenase
MTATTTDQLRFSHIGLFVSDLDRMEAFYRGVLHLWVTDRGLIGEVRVVFLSRDPGEHHQILLASGRPDSLEFTTVNQIALRADSLSTLREVAGRARRAGADRVSAVNHGNAVSVYFEDPEGNRLEVFVDTPWHVPQPLREPIDLAVSDEELMERVEQRVREIPGFTLRATWLEEMKILMQ